MGKINTNYKVPADAREYKHLNGKPKIITAADGNILHFVENDKNKETNVDETHEKWTAKYKTNLHLQHVYTS